MFFDILVYMLSPKRFGVPSGGKPHRCPVYIGIFAEKAFEFLFEGMIGITHSLLRVSMIGIYKMKFCYFLKILEIVGKKNEVMNNGGCGNDSVG